MKTPLRTRFAPSPTGELHIGNLRTAITAWLVARHHGGEFMLRLEDTDRTRSTPEAAAGVLEVLDWMGLDVDGEIVYQADRQSRHLEVAQALLASGHAVESDKGQADKGTCVVFVPKGAQVSFTDLVMGKMTKQIADLEEFVLVRSDGTPTYLLANTVDDLDMGITHVIRGAKNLENTFRQLLILQALEAGLPSYAHLPLIVNEAGKPYGKRDGAISAREFRDAGYLPDALLNDLALLGWSNGEDQEFFTREELVAAFDMDRVRSSPGCFNEKRLKWLNSQHMQRLDRTVYVSNVASTLQRAGWIEDLQDPRVEAVADLFGERIHLWSDLVEQADFLFTDEYAVDEKARKRVAKIDAVQDRVRELLTLIQNTESFDATTLEAQVKALADARGISVGKLFQILRFATAGRRSGPPLFPYLELMGREKIIERLDAFLGECV